MGVHTLSEKAHNRHTVGWTAGTTCKKSQLVIHQKAQTLVNFFSKHTYNLQIWPREA